MLSAKRQRFADEYLKDRNGSAAYQRAGYSATGNAAETAAYRLLRDPLVAAYIAAREAELRDELKIEQRDILQMLWDVAQADANELVQHRRLCCRYCFGIGFQYQRTTSEREAALRQWEKDQREADDDTPVEPFDEQGGVGYHKLRLPNPACPECFGEGVGDVYIPDTRHLSPAARTAYAGVKVTRDGIQIVQHSRVDAVINVGKHLGMFKEVLEHKGAVGMVDLSEGISPDQRERVAKEMLRAAGYEFDDER